MNRPVCKKCKYCQTDIIASMPSSLMLTSGATALMIANTTTG